MHNQKRTDWREHYTHVLFEANAEKLQMGIEAAHKAVQQRICELWDVEPADIRELCELASASYFLGLLSTITEQNHKAKGPIYSTVKPAEGRT